MPYWDQVYPNAKVPETRSVDEMIEGVRERMIEAVRLRLRSDVPIGIYLSGGIDSSCIAGIANHLLKKDNPNAKVTAFTLSFPGKETKYDEGPIAQRTAEYIGADMRVLTPSEDDIINAFEVSTPSKQLENTFNWFSRGVSGILNMLCRILAQLQNIFSQIWCGRRGSELF